MKEYEGNMKKVELVPLGGGGRVAKYEFGGGVGENKDMKHVNLSDTSFLRAITHN